MRGEKTKTPGKEFAAQVSDYIPSPRRKKSPEQTAPSSELSSNKSIHEDMGRKPNRSWSPLNRISGLKETPEETGHKPDTKWIQTEHKPRTKEDTNRTQTGHNNIQAKKQFSQTGHKLDTQPDTDSDTNRTQTEHKPDTKPVLTQLVGLQRKVIIFIYRACQIARGRTTDPLALEHVAKSLNIRTGSVKTTFRRLEEKGCLRRLEFKNGRGGWSKYELPDYIFAAVLQLETEHKLDTNWLQTGHKVDTQPDTQPDTTPSSSSSSLDLDLNRLTNTETDQTPGITPNRLPPEWESIEYFSLTKIRFGRGHVAQVAKQGLLAPEQLQESINAFAFDLEVNEKGNEINGQALNYFMGILRKGPYAPSGNYESPEVRQLRIYLEAKKREQKARLDLESELEAIEFDSWVEMLSGEERIRFVPPTDFAKPGSQGHNVQLKQYFREKVWPEQREKVLRADIREMREPSSI